MGIMGALVATNTGGYSEPVIYPLEDLQKPRIYLLDEPGEDDPKGVKGGVKTYQRGGAKLYH